jgi:hypothetical protein
MMEQASANEMGAVDLSADEPADRPFCTGRASCLKYQRLPGRTGEPLGWRYVAWTIDLARRFFRSGSVLLVGRMDGLAGLLQNILRILGKRSSGRHGKKLLIGVRAARRQNDFVGLGIDARMLH